MSYLEVYNENVRDLLTQTDQAVNLVIAEDPVKGIVVPGLKEIEVLSVSEALQIIVRGNQK